PAAPSRVAMPLHWLRVNVLAAAPPVRVALLIWLRASVPPLERLSRALVRVKSASLLAITVFVLPAWPVSAPPPVQPLTSNVVSAAAPFRFAFPRFASVKLAPEDSLNCALLSV